MTPEVEILDSDRALKQGSLDDLKQRFSARLTKLNQSDAAAKVDALFESQGRLEHPPKVGSADA